MIVQPAPRVLLAPTGTLGDVYPFIAVAVALALRARGCVAVVAAMDRYRGEVEGAGIAFRAVRPGRREMEAAGIDDAAIARAVARDQRAAFGFAAPHLAATLADLTGAARGCDMVVGGSLSSVARMVAETSGLPSATLILQPTGFLSCTDPPRLVEAPWLAAIGRRCGPAAVAALYRLGGLRGRAAMRPIAQLRAGLGLPRLRDELRDGPRRGAAMIALYPAAFAPLPHDAPIAAVSAGFPFYNGVPTALDPALSAFLDDGAPPIVFTLGSFVVHAAEDFYVAGAALARRLGRRAVLLVGDHAVGRHAGLAGPDLFVDGRAPHAALFPRAAAVVHHGGIGTVAEALRAGLPQLACPFFGDQFDNAAHLERLGVAAALPLRRFDPERGAALLAPLLAAPMMAARARVMGRRMVTGGGPGTAAHAIMGIVDRHRVRAGASPAREAMASR